MEVGAGGVSDGSFKAGQYNGLQRKGGFFLGDVDLRGGGAYDSGDATRYRITGTDLGLDTRRVSAEYGMQGSFRLAFGFASCAPTGPTATRRRTTAPGATC